MRILYVAGFRNEYNENIFIQQRKKKVISYFENNEYEIDFLYNSSTDCPLELSNSNIYYSKLLPCNVAGNFIEKTHNRLYKFSKIYSTLALKLIQKKFSLKINSYDVIITETWEHLSAIIPFVTDKKIIGRIYGTGNLTEYVEKKKWEVNPFFVRMKQVVNSDKVAGIIFNSTGSRSKDLFNLLYDNGKNSLPTPIYLDMPNDLFPFNKPKKRLHQGRLQMLQVGRMTDFHGFELTIKIVQQLVKEHKIPIEVHLAGNGESYNKIQELTQQYNLADYIQLPGRLGLDELKKYYSKADIVINYYGFNPVIEALNYKAFVITREFGEIGKILNRVFNKTIFSVCLPNCKTLVIEESLKKKYIDEAVKSVLWYYNNFQELTDSDFIPIKKITTRDFSRTVFSHYLSFFEIIKRNEK